MKNEEFTNLIDLISINWSSILEAYDEPSAPLIKTIDGVQIAATYLNLETDQKDTLMFLWGLALNH